MNHKSEISAQFKFYDAIGTVIDAQIGYDTDIKVRLDIFEGR